MDRGETLLKKKATLEAVLSRDKALQGSLPDNGARKPRCAMLSCWPLWLLVCLYSPMLHQA